MPGPFASGKHAIAECDRCGFRYKLKELRKLSENGQTVNILVCPECWEPENPQDDLGKFPVYDPQALRDPRPDIGVVQSRDIQWGWNPVGMASDYGLTPNNLIGNGQVGRVTVIV